MKPARNHRTDGQLQVSDRSATLNHTTERSTRAEWPVRSIWHDLSGIVLVHRVRRNQEKLVGLDPPQQPLANSSPASLTSMECGPEDSI